MAARAVCIGHSHSEAVARAAAAGGFPIEVLNFWTLPGALITSDGEVRFAQPVLERLRAPVFSLTGGAVHLDVGLMRHPRPFDVILPEDTSLPLDPGAEILPYGAVLHAMQRRVAPYLAVMTALRRAVSGDVFHMSAPAVFDSEQRPDDDPTFDTYFGADSVFASPVLRQKLWRIQNRLTEAHCLANGMEFIPVPAESITEAGFLRPGFAGKPGHANAAYGALLAQQIMDICDRRPASEFGRVA